MPGYTDGCRATCCKIRHAASISAEHRWLFSLVPWNCASPHNAEMSERPPSCPMCGSKRLKEVPPADELDYSPKYKIVAYECRCGVAFTIWVPIEPPPDEGSGILSSLPKKKPS